MSYRNSHDIHRSDQVWNRDIMHSNEEDSRPRGDYGGYGTGYSNRHGMQTGSAPGNYRNPSNNDYHGYDRSDRYGRRGDYREQYGRGDNYHYYDYESGRLTDQPDYDRYRYGRHEESRYDTDRRDSGRNWWQRSKDEVKSWLNDRDNDYRQRPGFTDHRGKGPKGYQRSDERIREDLNDRLSDDDRVDASDVEIEVSACEVILKGSVNSRAEKRRAEDIAESVSGIRNVENRLRVTQAPGGINMNRYTGTTGDFTGIGSSSGTTSEIIRDVRNSRDNRYD